MADWVDEIARERASGINRPLLPSEHAAVNARYPGCTVKCCPGCDAPIDDAQSLCNECAEAEEDELG